MTQTADFALPTGFEDLAHLAEFALPTERERHAKARIEAVKIIAECERGTHSYLASKGFPEAVGLIHPSGDLIIPMRDCQDYGTINTVQRVSADGKKLFLCPTV